MFVAKLLLLAAISFAYSAGATAPERQVVITVFFEGLSPASQKFITGTLYSAYKQLGDNLIFAFMPLGRSQHQEVNGKLEWTCENGPLECYISKINACAINLKSTNSQLVEFINCHTANTDASNTNDQQANFAKQCAVDNKLSFDDINSCVNSDVSDKLMLYYAAQVDKFDPELPSYPYVFFDGITNEIDEELALDNLAKVACWYFYNLKPEECKNVHMN